MLIKRIAKYLLPPIAVDAARWLRIGRHRMQATSGISIRYEVAPEWITPRTGTVTLDFDVVNRPPEYELQVPIVRDNLETLAHTATSAVKLDLLDFGSGNGHYK